MDTQGIQQFSVGTKFPLQYYQHDAMVPILAQSSLMFVITMNPLSEQEVEIFQNGKIEYGVTIQEGIPFVVVRFPGLASFDCFVNFIAELSNKRDMFLAEEPNSNLVQFFLVDCATGILRGIRTIGTEPKFMREIKEACFGQVSKYPTASAVSAAADAILNQHQTSDLMKRARMFYIRAK